MALLHVVTFILFITGAFCLKTTKNVVRTTGDWWNPCGPHEDYDLCPRYECVAESCLHFLGLLKCQDRGNNMPCRAECRCTKYYFRNRDGKCIPQHDCVPSICGVNEIFNKCHPCNYAKKSLKCPNANPKCKPGCYCKAGYIRDVFGECVEDKRMKLPVTKAPGCFTTISTTTIKPKDEDLSDEQYNMEVLPRAEDLEEKEQKDLSQTSFKILPINVQLRFDKKSNTSILTYQSNTVTDTLEPLTSKNNLSSTVYVYKYLNVNNSQVGKTEKKNLTTITIDTINDEEDLRVTKPMDDNYEKSKKNQEPDFYKYISVSVMDNSDKTILTNHTYDDSENDLSDIQVTTTTSRSQIIIFTTEKTANDSFIMSSFTTEIFSEPDLSNLTVTDNSELIENNTEINEYFGSNHSTQLNDLTRNVNVSQFDGTFHRLYTPFSSFAYNLTNTNSSQFYNNIASEIKNKEVAPGNLGTSNIADTSDTNATTDLKLIVTSSDTAVMNSHENETFRASNNLSATSRDSTSTTTPYFKGLYRSYLNTNPQTNLLGFNTSETTNERNITKQKRFFTKFINTTQDSSFQRDNSSTYHTQILISRHSVKNLNHSTNQSEKKFNVRVRHASKVPKGLSYIW